MNGIRIDSADAHAFAKIFAPVMQQMAERYWLIDHQSSPFWIFDDPSFPDFESQLDKQKVDVPQFENSSESLWRPATFPRFASKLVVDEWTYMFGVLGPEERAISSAIRISQGIGRMSQEFFDLVRGESAIFLMHVDGWWEVYSTDAAFIDLLVSCCQATPITSQRWEDEAKGIYSTD